MESILLVVAMYVSPESMINDTPVEFTKQFSSTMECEAYKERHTEMLNNALEDGLIAYSIRCNKV